MVSTKNSTESRAMNEEMSVVLHDLHACGLQWSQHIFRIEKERDTFMAMNKKNEQLRLEETEKRRKFEDDAGKLMSDNTRMFQELTELKTMSQNFNASVEARHKAQIDEKDKLIRQYIEQSKSIMDENNRLKLHTSNYDGLKMELDSLKANANKQQTPVVQAPPPNQQFDFNQVATLIGNQLLAQLSNKLPSTVGGSTDENSSRMKLTELENENLSLTNKLNERDVCISDLKVKLKDTEEHLGIVQKSFTSMIFEPSSAKKSCPEFLSNTEMLGIMLKENTELKERVKVLETSVGNENVDVSYLNSEISRLQSENSRLGPDITKFRSEIEASNILNIKLKQEIEEQKQINEKLKAEANEECKRLNDKVTEEEEKFNKLNVKLVKEVEVSKQLRKEIEKFNSFNEEMAKCKNFNEPNANNASLEMQVQSLTSENQELLKRVQDLEIVSEKLYKEKECLKTSDIVENNNNNKKTPKSSDVKKLQELLTMERNKNKTLLNEINNFKEVLEKRLTDEEFKKNLPKVLSDQCETFLNMKRAIDQLKDKLEKLEKEHQQTVKQLRDEFNKALKSRFES